jgi:hypothetical protein
MAMKYRNISWRRRKYHGVSGVSAAANAIFSGWRRNGENQCESNISQLIMYISVAKLSINTSA